MTKTWQLRAFSLYLTLGMPLAASCAKEANTLEGDDTGDVAGGTSTSGKGSIGTAGTLSKAGTTSNAFGGSATSGGKGGVAGDTSAEGGDSASVGGTGGKGGAGGSATGGGSTTVPPEVLASAKAIVYYQTDHATASDKMIRMVLHITNQSDNSLPMKNVKIRYWFTAEATPKLNQYYTGEDVRPPSAKFIDDGANSHVLMTFGAGAIKKGDIISRSEVQLAIDSETTAFDQANDFSWQATSLTSKPNDKITLYLDDKLIWGCEPSGACPDDAGAGGVDAGGQGAGGGP
jgi:Cellulose binding domain